MPRGYKARACGELSHQSRTTKDQRAPDRSDHALGLALIRLKQREEALLRQAAELGPDQARSGKIQLCLGRCIEFDRPQRMTQ
jgi:hypothetical protein